jgi:hypothetical protein
LQKNKTYYSNILVQITVKKLTLFSVISFEYFACFHHISNIFLKF